MLTPQHPLDLAPELVIDLFAGGGGASTGIEQALGYPPHIAINHDPEAVALHQANHPQTRHYVSDVFEVDPAAVTEGRAVGLLWASPDCKHFSKAKGGKPVSKKIRSLAWVVVKWAKAVRPRVICLENVEEFQTWGPLGADDRPCPLRKGRTFRRWKRSLERMGYAIEHRELRACDYGAPTPPLAACSCARTRACSPGTPPPSASTGALPALRSSNAARNWPRPPSAVLPRA
jgi:DNA (cytosine-5)-methyltransferase 1